LTFFRKANITVESSVPGLTLTLDGAPRPTPNVFTGVVGIVRELGAPATQAVDCVAYEFVRWSDGGAAVHTISTPAIDTTYVAVYRPATSIVGRYVFYNHSSFDGRDALTNAADDSAIATDKQPLLPGESAAFENYTSYTDGINGILIDIKNGGLPVTAENFTFRVGNDNSSESWAAAPPPALIDRRDGAGVDGSDRITLVWPDRSIRNEWLRVSYSVAVGEPPRDVFYFGNAVGETGTSPGNAAVNAIDQVSTRAHLHTPFAGITNQWDFNRDGRVNILDLLVVRRNVTARGSVVQLIAPPAALAEGNAANALPPPLHASAGAPLRAFSTTPIRGEISDLSKRQDLWLRLLA